jgi:hypothetical protein
MTRSAGDHFHQLPMITALAREPQSAAIHGEKSGEM